MRPNVVMFHTDLRAMRNLVSAVLILFSFRLMAGEIETDLNGFRLHQFVNVAETVLGPTFKTIDAGQSVVNAYQIDERAYMVVGHHKKYPNHISILQLTGLTTKALPFKGLLLGDSEDKVIRTLGKPDRVEKIASPNVSKFAYNDRNYTVEIDESGRLYSIQIFTTTDLLTKTDGTESEWPNFKAAVLSKDFVRVVETLRPDVEIYKSEKVLSINTRYSEFIKNPEKGFVLALLGETDSVLREMSQSEPEQEIRLVMEFGVGRVYKFPKGKILKEVAFFPYNGKYRVYEIAFKEKSK